MKRLVIAIDCDDVLIPSTEYIVSEYNRLFGTVISLDRAHESNSPQWQASREEIAKRIDQIQLTPRYGLVPPFHEATAAYQALGQTHELHLVTARPEVIMGVTNQMLEQYFYGLFTSVEHVGQDGNKGDICQHIGADIIIDDNHKHLLTAKASGVKHLVWFGDYAWQDDTVAAPDILRCRDWGAVLKVVDAIT